MVADFWVVEAEVEAETPTEMTKDSSSEAGAAVQFLFVLDVCSSSSRWSIVRPLQHYNSGKYL